MLAPVLVFGPSVMGNRVLGPGDGYLYYLPMHAHVGELWAEGVIPSWNPFAFAGSPLMAISQSAVWYPPNLLHAFVNDAVANDVRVVLAFIAAGVGGHLLAGRLVGDARAAAVAGVAVALGGFMFAHLGHQAIIATFAWLPWVLWALDRLVERIDPMRVLVAALALGMCVVAGHPQMLVLTALTAGCWTLARVALDRPPGRPWWRPLSALALTGVAGAAVGAVHLLPVLAVLGATDRSALAFEDATSLSFELSHTPLYLFPYLFGGVGPDGPFAGPYRGLGSRTELGVYVGAAALGLAAAGFTRWRRHPPTMALVVAAAAIGLITLGAVTPLAGLVHATPVLGEMRAWARYGAVVGLAVAVLAAHGVAHLLSSDRTERRRAAAIAAVVPGVMFVFAVIAPHVVTFRVYRSPGAGMLLALAVPLAFAAVVPAAMALVSRRAVVWVALLAVGLDLVVSYGWWYDWRRDAPDPAVVEAMVTGRTSDPRATVHDADGGIDRVMFVGVDVNAMRPWVAPGSDLVGIRHVNGYDPLIPAEYADAAADMDYTGAVLAPEEVWRDGGALLHRLRVTTVLVDPATAPLPPADLLGEGVPVPASRLVRHTLEPVLPDAFVAGHVVEVDGDEAAAAATSSPPGLFGSTVVVDGCTSCAAIDGTGGGTATARFGANRVTASVRADGPSMLVVSQAHFPGWAATVNGDPADVVRIDGLVTGVPVPRGESNVVLHYEPPGLRLGVVVSVLSLLLLSTMVLRHRLARCCPKSQARRSRTQMGDLLFD